MKALVKTTSVYCPELQNKIKCKSPIFTAEKLMQVLIYCNEKENILNDIENIAVDELKKIM